MSFNAHKHVELPVFWYWVAKVGCLCRDYPESYNHCVNLTQRACAENVISMRFVKGLVSMLFSNVLTMHHIFKGLLYLLLGFVILTSSLICLSTKANAQLPSKGEVVMVKRCDSTITFSYLPPALLLLPASMDAAVVYKCAERYQYRAAPLVKNGDVYSFSISLPAEVNAVIVAVKDQAGSILDNNHESGYTPSIFHADKSRSVKTYVETIELLSYYAEIVLKLNYKTVQNKILNLYEKGFGEYPEWKKVDAEHKLYLRLLYNRNQDSIRPILHLLADSLSLTENEGNCMRPTSLPQRNLKAINLLIIFYWRI